MGAQRLPKSYGSHLRSVQAARTRAELLYFTLTTQADIDREYYRRLKQVNLRGESTCTALTIYAPAGLALMVI